MERVKKLKSAEFPNADPIMLTSLTDRPGIRRETQSKDSEVTRVRFGREVASIEPEKSYPTLAMFVRDV